MKAPEPRWWMRIWAARGMISVKPLRSIDMKRIACLVSVMMLVLAGCQKNDVANPERESVHSDFTGVVEGLLDTKTTIDRNRNVRWSEGDQVVIFEGSTLGGKFQVTKESVGETSADFEFISEREDYGSGFDMDHNVAFYPYDSKIKCANGDDNNPTESYLLTHITLPSEQKYVEESFGQATFPMVAVTSSKEDKNLSFKNVLGGLRLQLKGDFIVSSITVRGNEDELLAGTASVKAFVDGSDPEVTMDSGAETSVVLDCGEAGVALDADTPVDFIIPLPPTVFKSGFKVMIQDMEGRLRVIKTSKENTVYRSSLLKMPEIDVNDSHLVYMDIPETEVLVSAAGGELNVEVQANVEYDVVMPEVDWLSLPDSEFAGVFVVEENVEYDHRSAEVIFQNEAHGLQKVLKITQLQKGAILLAQDEFDVDVAGGTIDIDLQTNVDFEVSMWSNAQSWISFVSTRALEDKVLTLSIEPCSDEVDRTGYVTLSDGEITQKIVINQYLLSLNEPIVFADPNTKKVCVDAFDENGDGELSYREAKKVDGIGRYMGTSPFREIGSFDEFQYFTSIRTIGFHCFGESKNLTSIIIPDSVTSIEFSAFEDCSNLTSLTLGSGLTSIGEDAFEGCSGLTGS